MPLSSDFRLQVQDRYLEILGKPEKEVDEATANAAAKKVKEEFKEEIEVGRKRYCAYYRDAFDKAYREIPEEIHNLEFLAKTLHQEDDFLTATPIYVAFG